MQVSTYLDVAVIASSGEARRSFKRRILDRHAVKRIRWLSVHERVQHGAVDHIVGHLGLHARSCGLVKVVGHLLDRASHGGHATQELGAHGQIALDRAFSAVHLDAVELARVVPLHGAVQRVRMVHERRERLARFLHEIRALVARESGQSAARRVLRLTHAAARCLFALAALSRLPLFALPLD